ncbi:MAG: DUF58 domain-containing protein [bacterium]
MRPTRKAVLLMAAGIPLSVVLILIQPGLWFYDLAATITATVFCALDAVLAAPVRALRLGAQAPNTLHIGEEDRLRLRIGLTSGPRRSPLAITCDVNGILPPAPRLETVVGPGFETEAELPLRPLRRGTAGISRVWLRWPGPLGLVAVTHVRPLNIKLSVVPNIRAVRAAAIEFQAHDAMFGIKVDRHLGDGTEFDALREYVPGLDRRSIDWKHSARHRKLLSKEFRAERNHQIVLAFDTGQLMAEPLGGIPRLDHAVTAGLHLGYLSSRSEDYVGLFGFDSRVRHYLRPTAGTSGFLALRRASAALEYRPDETNFTLGLTDLTVRLNRRSLIVLFTEFIDTITAELMLENVARLASRHMVIFVVFADRDLAGLIEARPSNMEQIANSVVAGDFIRERAIVLERLNRLGVLCIEAAPDAVSAQLINAYLDIKNREMI